MVNIKVASRYSKAVIELAKEEGKLERVKEDFDVFLETCKNSRDLRLLLQNPIVFSDKKFHVMETLFGKHFDKITLTFFKLVCRQGREAVLMAIADNFLQRYQEIKGVQRAELTTTFAPSAEMIASFEKLTARLSGKSSVEMKVKIDKDLIGGFVLTMGDRQLDASVAGKLKSMSVALAK